jgi:uncharacterized protein (TIGR01440 family)
MSVFEESYAAMNELLELSGVKAGAVVVVGCSTSEVCGGTIGHNSSPETAEEIYGGLKKAADEHGVFIAAQCCEHLNRAIIVERAAVKAALECGVMAEVNVVPQPKAGGSFATAAYKHASDPIALEHIKADCGLDIGGTLIGMHLKEVAVPVRLTNNKIGSASLLAARVRPKFIGGIRAQYDMTKA